MLSPRVYLVLRLVTGLLFMGTGAFKLFGSLAPALPQGPAGFAMLLAQIGVPLPLASAYFVCMLELVGGGLMAAGFGVRAIASLLAIDMTVAFLTVGLPAALGHPVHLGTHLAGQEPWRVPLEIGLLAAMLVLANGRVKQAAS